MTKDEILERLYDLYMELDHECGDDEDFFIKYRDSIGEIYEELKKMN